MSDRTIPAGSQDSKGFRALTELVPDFVAVVDVAGVISYVSRAIERVMGYLPGEVIGAPFLTFIHPEDQRTAREGLARLLASSEVIPANLRFRHKDGSFQVLETLAKNYSGTPERKGVLVSIRDIRQHPDDRFCAHPQCGFRHYCPCAFAWHYNCGGGRGIQGAGGGASCHGLQRNPRLVCLPAGRGGGVAPLDGRLLTGVLWNAPERPLGVISQ